MSELKATPGPWYAVRNSSFWEVNPEECTLPHTVGDVCSSDPENPDGGLQEANAHLIAAAPELYAALMDMVTSYEAMGAPLPMSREVELALSALAKARGES